MLILLSLAMPTLAATVGGEVPDINVQNFRPTIDGERTLWVDDARLQDRLLMGRFLLHYANDPLVYLTEGGEETALVSDVFQADLMAGVRFWRARVGVDLPVYLLQSGTAGQGLGLGDIGLDGKIVVLDPASVPLGLALDAKLTVPSATVDNALGSPELGWEAAAVVEKPIGRAFVATNLGVRGGPAAELENINIDDFFVARLAAGYGFNDACGAALELASEVSLASASGQTGGFPLEALASGYGYLGYDWVIRGGAGAGLSSGIGTPDFRVIVGLGYEPRPEPPPPPPPDTDGDGLADPSDACPAEPEDADAFKDEDGCPDPDNDGDGLADAADRCPLEAEDADEVKDTDGCPEPEVRVQLALVNAADKQPLPAGRLSVKGEGGAFTGGPAQVLELPPGKWEATGTAVNFETAVVPFEITSKGMAVTVEVQPKQETKIVVTRDRIELKEKVYFDTAKATIQSRSFPLLDQVAEVMKAYPEIQLVRVEGHTDSRGNDAQNLGLSQRRADSVAAYLVGKGVESTRLVAKGLGETKPIDPAENATAWEKNRRVEINVETWVEIPMGAASPAAEPPKSTTP